MRSCRVWVRVVLGCLLLALCCVQQLAQAASLPVFPTKGLASNKALAVPPRSGWLFLAIGLHPRTQPLLETALSQVQPLRKQHPELQMAEIAVVDKGMFPDNGITRAFMRSQVKNKTLMPLIYASFTDLRALQTKLGLSAKQELVLVLVDAAGEIQFSSTQQRLDAESLKRLSAALE